MTRPTTEALRAEIQKLVKKHNDAIDVQQNAKQRIIEIQAILKDREDGDTEVSTSTDSEN